MTASFPSTFALVDHRSFFPDVGQALLAQARQWDAVAGTVVSLSSTNATARRARLHISYGQLSQPCPSWCARFWEEDILKGFAPIEWLLASDKPITRVQDALALLVAAPEAITDIGCI